MGFFSNLFVLKSECLHVMSFYQNRICLAFEINHYKTLVNFAYKRCCYINKLCIVIKDSLFYLKCSKCVCANKLYVNMS